jgi:hypothetical protein
VSQGAILILREPISPPELKRLVAADFKTMVKYVVDIERGLIAIGGGLHADAEATLLEEGCDPRDLWGANYYPGRGREGCIEYTSMINIRPARGNPGMEVLDEDVRKKIQVATFRLIGEGESLS